MPSANQTPVEISLEIPKLPDMKVVLTKMARHAAELLGLPGKTDEIKTYLENAAADLKDAHRMRVLIRLSDDQLEFETRMYPTWVPPGPQTPIPLN